MSRDYGTYPRFGLRKRSRIRPRRPPGCGVFLLVPLFAVVLLFFWITRNTSEMADFIPEVSAFEIYTTDPLETAQRVSGSKVWDIIPDERPEYDLRYILAGSMPLPEWLVRNLFFGLCHVHGNDLENFSDAVVVTHITRVGSLAEKLQNVVSLIERDTAGGLHLRRVGDTGVYYAVRGRTLLISPSRDALIDALTLREELRINPERLAQMERELENLDIMARIRKHGNQLGASPLAQSLEHFDDITVRAIAENTALRLTFAANLNAETRTRYAPFLDGMAANELRQLHENMLGISWNFGMPLHELWARFNALQDEPLVLAALLGGTSENSEASALGDPLHTLSAILGCFGNSGRIMLRSVDQNEMLPMPELVGLFEADTTRFKEHVTALEPWLEGDGALTYSAFYDAESKSMRMPLVGGPAMEITAALYGDEAMLAISRPAALALMAETPVQDKFSQPANLYVEAKPADLAHEIDLAGMQLAEAGLLRDHTPESFAATSEKWKTTLAKIGLLAAMGTHNDGVLELDLKLLMADGQ